MQPHLASMNPLSPAFVRLFQLEAEPTGSADLAVLRFASVPEIVGTAINVTTTSENGSVISIFERGIYAYSFDAFVNADDGTAFGIAKNTDAAGLVGVPFLSTAGIIAASVVVPPLSGAPPLHLGGTFYVSQAEASAPGGALLRFLATNDGGGAPTELASGSVVAQIHRIADWPA